MIMNKGALRFVFALVVLTAISCGEKKKEIDASTDVSIGAVRQASVNNPSELDGSITTDASECSGKIWAGHVAINSSSDIELLAGYSTIAGNLSIQNSDLVGLNGLGCLTQIDGFLKVQHNDALIDLKALANLERIGNHLDIQHNEALTKIGLKSLSYLGNKNKGLLKIIHNPNLPQCYAEELRDQLRSHGWTRNDNVHHNGDGPCHECESGPCCEEGFFLPAGEVCRPVAGACDVEEVCSGNSAECPDDEFISEGTECRSEAGVCDLVEYCTGTSAECPADELKPTTEECRPSADICDVAENCTGVSADCPTDGFESSTTICRESEGICDVAEMCTGNSAACPANGFAQAGTECRASAGICDVAEGCSGDSAECPADGFAPAIVECRAAAGICDVAEMCTGNSAKCPTNGFVQAGTECRASAGVCDVAETCSGDSPECPVDGFTPTTVECRASTGVCDVAETCTGNSAACPVNGFVQPGTECRESAGVCDIPEVCSGSSADCPTDSFAPSTAECRPIAGMCDVAEYCSGASAICPADGFASTTIECRPASDMCDVIETCSGASPDCPSDLVASNTTLCRSSAGICDVDEYCDGVLKQCPEDQFAPRTTICREAAGICDVGETCDGVSAECPVDDFVTAGTECREPAGDCDVSESCTGSSAYCPEDDVAPNTALCREPAGLCDVEEICDGISVVCPPNLYKPYGTSCSNQNVCDGEEYCDSAGACLPGAPPSTDDDNPCTEDSCDPVLGVQHQALPEGSSCIASEACSGNAGFRLSQTQDIWEGYYEFIGLGVPITAFDWSSYFPEGAHQSGELLPYLGAMELEAVGPDGLVSTIAGLLNIRNWVDGPGFDSLNGTAAADLAIDDVEIFYLEFGWPVHAVGFPVITGTSNAPGQTDLLGATFHLTALDDSNETVGTALFSLNAGEVDQTWVSITSGTPFTQLIVEEIDTPGIEDQYFGNIISTECDSPNLCILETICNADAQCVASGVPEIDDNNPCTIDTCDPEFGPVHTPVEDGMDCSDGDLCNGTETCQAGQCTDDEPLDIDDGNPCTKDSCDPINGIIHEPIPDGTRCSDNDICNGEEICQSGACVSSGIPESGIITESISSQVGDADAFGTNAEPGAPIRLIDFMPDDPPGIFDETEGGWCTLTSFEWTHQFAIPNGATIESAQLTITTWDLEDAGEGDGRGGEPYDTLLFLDNIEWPMAFDTTYTADSTAEEPIPPNITTFELSDTFLHQLEDGELNVTVDAAGGSLIDCIAIDYARLDITYSLIFDDGNPCTTDSCDPVQGPIHTPIEDGIDCSDGNVCNGMETCQDGICIAGTPPDIDDNNPCTSDSCDSIQGPIHTPVEDGIECLDGDLCNGTETCQAGQCTDGEPLAIDDGNPCTEDSCDPVLGVSHLPTTPGTVCSCTTPECNGGITVPAGFQVRKVADIARPMSLAVPPSPSSFSPGLYVGEGANNDETCSVLRVSESGAVLSFAVLGRGSIPSLKFGPDGTAFAGRLIASANHAHSGQTGGAVQSIGPAGDVVDLTPPIGQPGAPSEQMGLVIPRDTAYGTGILLANAWFAPGDILRVDSQGGLTTFLSDGRVGSGLSPVDVEFGPGGDWGDELFFADIGDSGNCVRVAYADGTYSECIVAPPGTAPRTIAFGPGGPWGTDMYVAPSGSEILRVARDGSSTTFAGGFLAIGAGGADAILFSPDGSVLYVADYTGNAVYAVRSVDTCDDAGQCVRTNQPPVVDAGGSQVVSQSASAALFGSAQDDGLPADGTLTLEWSVVSGPGEVIFSEPTSANTDASFSEPGEYILQLEATDGELSSADEVVVTVTVYCDPLNIDDGNPCTADSCDPIEGVIHEPYPDGTECGDESVAYGIYNEFTSFSQTTSAELLVDFGTPGTYGSVYRENGVEIRQVDGFDTFVVQDTSPATPGHEFVVSGPESINIKLPSKTSAFGMYLEDSTLDPASTQTCPKSDSSFEFTFKNGGESGEIVASLTVDPPTNEQYFLGIVTRVAFDFIEIREQGAEPGEAEGPHCENDYFGDIYIGNPIACEPGEDCPPAICQSAVCIPVGEEPYYDLVASDLRFNMDLSMCDASTAEVLGHFERDEVTGMIPPIAVDVPVGPTYCGDAVLTVSVSLCDCDGNHPDEVLYVYLDGELLGTIDARYSMQTSISQSAIAQYDGVNLPVVVEAGIGVASVYDVRASIDYVNFVCPDRSTLTARLGNEGSLSVPDGVNVAFYDGDPNLGGDLLAVQQTNETVNPGQFEDVTVTVSPPLFGFHDIYAVADSDGSGIGSYLEVDEENNKIHETYRFCNSPPQIVSAPITTVYKNEVYLYDVDAIDLEDDAISYSLEVSPEGMTIDNSSGAVEWDTSIYPTSAPRIAEGLLIYYPFDGNGNDESGNQYHGTLNSVEFTSSGKFEGAAVFDGSGGNVVRQSTSWFNIANGESQTMSAWFRKGPGSGILYNRYGSSHPNCIYGGAAGTSAWILIKIDEAPTVHFRDDNNSDEQIFGITGNYDDNAWHHVAVVISKSNWTISIFMDGDFISTTEITQSGPQTFDDPIEVGSMCDPWGNYGGGFNGEIDEFQLYSRALSAEEIGHLYGLHAVTVRATDDYGKYDEQSFIVGVVNNTAPVVDAGPDLTVEWNEVATLEGTVTDDGLPEDGILTVEWSVVSGPGEVIFSNPTSAVTDVSFSEPGEYILQLEATDGELSDADEVSVEVLSSCIAPPPGMVAWWPGDGNTLDIQGGNHGILENGASFTTGIVDDAFVFDGVDDIVEVPDSPAFHIQNSFTIDAWVNVGAQVATTFGPSIVDRYRADTAGYDLRIDSTGTRYRCNIDNGPTDYNVFSTTLTSPGTFQHVACTFDGTTLRTYVNGVLEASGSAPVAADISEPLYIGSRPNVEPSFPIVVDEVELFNRALSTDEIRAIFEAGRAGKCKASQPNQPPFVYAGPDKLVELPDQIVLEGSIEDDGSPNGTLTSLWTQLTGPGAVQFDDDSSPQTTAHTTVAGMYDLRLSADDGEFFVDDQTRVCLSEPNLRIVDDFEIDGDFSNWRRMMTNCNCNRGPVGINDGVLWTGTGTEPAPGASEHKFFSTLTDFSPLGEGIIARAKIRFNGDYQEFGFGREAMSHSSEPGEIAVRFHTGERPTDEPNTVFMNVESVDDDGVWNTVYLEQVPLSWYEFHELTIEWRTTDARFLIDGVIAGQTSIPLGCRQELTIGNGRPQLMETDWVEVYQIGMESNAPPEVNAGPDFEGVTGIVLNLDGIVVDDGFPTSGTLTSSWTHVSGPGFADFGDQSSPATTVVFSESGVHTLRLTASDGELGARDEVQITVGDAVINEPPIVFAGDDQEITLPDHAILTGTVTDDGLPEGSILTTHWSQQAGPGIAAFTDPNSAATSVTFDNPGTYILRLTADDSEYSSSDDVQIIVHEENQPPIVDVGPDFSVTLPDTATINATVTDDGLPNGTLSYQWSQIGGLEPVVFGSPNSPSTSVTFAVAGTYTLRLTADDSELFDYDDVVVTVNPDPTVNQPPTVSCTADHYLLQQPEDVVTVTCVVEDDDLPEGEPLTTQWSIESPLPDGPETIYYDAVSITARLPIPGDYTFILTVSDSEYEVEDSVLVTLIPPNQSPVVDAGPDQTITFPASANLNGSVDDDGLPNGTLDLFWTQESGPPGVIFDDPYAAVTAATFPSPGSYDFRLTASDGELSDFDDVHIEVNEPGPNQPPIVNAGPDREIQMPTNSVVLNGVVDDDGLPVGVELAITWDTVEGPGVATFDPDDASVTTATFPVAGRYTLELCADDSEFRPCDEVVVMVWGGPGDPIEISIDTPEDSASVTEPTSIIGTVSGDDLFEWYLESRMVGDSDWQRFAEGEDEVVAGDLGTFDPTLLLNGIYEMRLTAIGLSRQMVSTEITLVVDGNQKVGNFTVSFRDLSVPVAGIPIEVIRTYDSRNKNRGDFGVGWTLDINSLRVQKNRVVGANWETEVYYGVGPFGIGDAYCVIPARRRYVTVTFADGKVFRFEASIDAPGSGWDGRPECQLGDSFPEANVVFTALPGTNATLTRRGGTAVLVSGDWPGNADIMTTDYGSVFDPDDFVVTLLDGRELDVATATGLEQVTDTNGNVLEIRPDGLVHSSGRSVTFDRDAQGRILAITDPMGYVLSYEYDEAGDLVSFIDAALESTHYAYDDDHYLLGIQDARGITPIQNSYDASGRLTGHTDALGHSISYEHDLVQSRETVCDRLNHCTVHAYDDRGNVLSTTDALGYVTTYDYDDRDNQTSECNPLGQCSEYTYDDDDNRTSETDPLGYTTIYTYDGRGNMLTVTDPLGRVTTNTYDGSGNLTRVEDPEGNFTEYTYNPAGLQTSMTDALGNVTRYEYDDFGNLTLEEDSTGHITTYEYDDNGNRIHQETTRTLGDGTVETLVTEYEYDELNRLIRTIYPDGSTSEIEYDEVGQQEATIDALGRRTEQTYDALGRLIETLYPDGTTETSDYDAEGRRVRSTDRAGRQTQYDYDELGRLTRTIFPDGTNTQTVYDEVGRTSETIDEEGYGTTFTYDDAGRRTDVTDALGNVTHFEYDDVGNQETVTDPLGNITTFEYDDLNRQIAVIHPDDTIEETEYDAMGRRIAKIDQASVRTEYGYDAVGRLVSVLDALGGLTQYEYDELGNQVSQIDALGRVTSFEYDNKGRRIMRTLPLGAYETMSYDLAGNLTDKTDFMGRTISYEYDQSNRMIRKLYPDTTEVSFTYTPTGQRETATDARGVTSYDYDLRDRVTENLYPDGRRLEYDYDNRGNRIALIANIGETSLTTTYTYDELSRLDTVTDPNGGVYTYGYDDNGRRTLLTQPNGTETSYQYDDLNRLRNLITIHTPTSTTIQSYAYTLGATGIRTRIDEHDGTARIYGYDDLYRLTDETVTGSAETDYTKTFTYDAVGNRWNQTTTGYGEATVGYTYDDRDRLLTENATTYSWDENGNLISKTGEATYAWDYDDRLIRVDMADGTVVTHTYDVDGVRVQSVTTPSDGGDLVEKNYLVDTTGSLSHVVAESDENGNVTAYYDRGGDQLLGMIKNAEVRYYHADGLGSVRALSSESGVSTDTYEYTAFGESLDWTSIIEQPYRFTGEEWEKGDYYYLRERYANVGNGRFLSGDPAGGKRIDPPSLNRYSYAHNAPTHFTDPQGTFITLPDLLSGIVCQSSLRKSQAVRSYIGARQVQRKAEAFVNYTNMIMGLFRPDSKPAEVTWNFRLSYGSKVEFTLGFGRAPNPIPSSFEIKATKENGRSLATLSCSLGSSSACTATGFALSTDIEIPLWVKYEPVIKLVGEIEFVTQFGKITFVPGSVTRRQALDLEINVGIVLKMLNSQWKERLVSVELLDVIDNYLCARDPVASNTFCRR